jgi:hypothetical protein
MTAEQAEFSDAMVRAFRCCVDAVLADEAMLAQYRRLYGSHFMEARSPVQRMVDAAAGFPGFTEAEANAFFDFVREVVFLRLPVPTLLALAGPAEAP